MMKKLAILGLTIWCFTALCGCNTIHGAGKDIEKTGQAIEKSTQ